jgi:hypothetical protein
VDQAVHKVMDEAATAVDQAVHPDLTETTDN